MKLQTPLPSIVFAATCLAAAWSATHFRAQHGSGSPAVPAPLMDGAMAGRAGVAALAGAAPVNARITQLDVPLNSWVRRGQIIGETDEGAGPDPSSGWEARQSLAEADYAVREARAQLRAVDSAIAAARVQVTDQEYRLVAAEAADAGSESAMETGNRLYRQGMENELEHDSRIGLRQSARLQAEQQRSQASLALSTIDELETRRTEAQSELRGAQARRRIASAAIPDCGVPRGEVPVASPADGFLIMSEDHPGAFEIVPNLSPVIAAAALR